MREIKFRGKSVDGVWRYGSVVYYGDKETPRIIPFGAYKSDLALKVNPNTIGQFTGIYDMNGKEIFEGDILRYPPKNSYEESNYTAFEVFYHDNDACDTHIGWQINRSHVQGGRGESSPSFKPYGTKRLVVIGNIHDNPELL